MIHIFWLILSLAAVFTAFFLGRCHERLCMGVWHPAINKPKNEIWCIGKSGDRAWAFRLKKDSKWTTYKDVTKIKQWAYISDMEKLPEVKKSS